MLQPEKEYVTKKVPSPMPFYIVAAIWLFGSFTLKMYKFSSYLILAAVSVAGYFIARIFFPAKEEQVEVQTVRTYYSQMQQEFIESGTKSLQNIAQLNSTIKDPKMQQEVNALISTTDQILDCVYKKPEAVTGLRKLTNYYLPTIEKLLVRYNEIQDTNLANVSESMDKIENIITTTNAAFQKQLSDMYDTDTLDINSEVKVLEQIFVQEGLIDPENK